MSKKLYALTDEQVEVIDGWAHCERMNSNDDSAVFAAGQISKDLSTPLEVHGTDLMATFENHMTVTGSGGGLVCSECGHRYSRPISKPQAWEHATIAALEALLQENES